MNAAAKTALTGAFFAILTVLGLVLVFTGSFLAHIALDTALGGWRFLR